MASNMRTLEEAFREKNKTCFVLGASGETGKQLLKELLDRKIFSKITLIGRRQLTFEDKAHESVVSQIHAMSMSPLSLWTAYKAIWPHLWQGCWSVWHI